MTPGIDVSSCQGLISWKDVPDAIKFVVCKVSEGMYGKDPSARANLEGARATGRMVGVYHFVHLLDDVKKAADNLWAATGDTMPSFPPALDLEVAPDDMKPEVVLSSFLDLSDAVEAEFGRPPLVYTYPWFEKTRVGPAVVASAELRARLARLDLWMADLSAGENPPPTWHPFLPSPWTDWVFAQTSGNNSSHVAGIGGGKVAVDHDWFNGDYDALVAYARNGRTGQT